MFVNNSFIGNKTKNFGIHIMEGNICEYGLFRRGKLDGYGIRASPDGKIEGHFEKGLLHGIAFSYVGKEKFGLLAEYSLDSINKIILKTTKLSQTKVGRSESPKTC